MSHLAHLNIYVMSPRPLQIVITFRAWNDVDGVFQDGRHKTCESDAF